MFEGIKNRVKKVMRKRVLIVDNPILSNKGGGDGRQKDPLKTMKSAFARPKAAGTPKKSPLRVPKSKY